MNTEVLILAVGGVVLLGFVIISVQLIRLAHAVQGPKAKKAGVGGDNLGALPSKR